MPELDDQQLLAEFVGRNSEAAFTSLVARHVNLVYSAALRFTGNRHHAEEITQAVFIILARKAGSLRRDVVLSGWLYQTARLTAANFVKGEIRRQRREQEAYMQSAPNESDSDSVWRQLAPLLEDAMARLTAKDRELLALRYFENRTGAETAALLGIHEWAARKRAERAVDKLRAFFVRHGIAVSAGSLIGAISANSVHAAPVGLATTISAAAVKGAALATSTFTLVKGVLKIMAWSKAKTAITAGTAAIVAAGLTTIVVTKIAKPAATDAERGPVVMEMKWQVGKRYAMHREQTQMTGTKQPDRPKPGTQSVKMTQDLDFVLLKELDGGGWQLQLEFKRLTLEVFEGDRLTLSANSDPDPAREAGQAVEAQLRRMVGARLQYFLDANCKVQRMEGYPELVNRVAGKSPQEQGAFKELFDEADLTKLGSFAEDTTPRRVVKLGESWPVTLEVPSDNDVLNVDLKCTFKNWEARADRRCMRIGFTGSLSAGAGAKARPPRIAISKARISGDVWFDPELGMLVDKIVEDSMDMQTTQRGESVTMPFSERHQLTLLAVENAEM